MSLHVGIIMDGNGRWATQQGKARLEGHKAGIQAVLKVVRAAPSLGIDTITLFAFAIANWKRDKQEVDGLWKLFHSFFMHHMQELVAEGVCVKIIGNRDGLPEHILQEVEKVETQSKDNTKFLLQIALNYDGVDEVVRMVREIVTNDVKVASITAEYIQSHLDTQPVNEPDIVIRTGMEPSVDGMSSWRSSAFLPLQSVQSVCVSTEVLWPDFSPVELQKVIMFADTDARLFGGQREV